MGVQLQDTTAGKALLAPTLGGLSPRFILILHWGHRKHRVLGKLSQDKLGRIWKHSEHRLGRSTTLPTPGQPPSWSPSQPWL